MRGTPECSESTPSVPGRGVMECCLIDDHMLGGFTQQDVLSYSVVGQASGCGVARSSGSGSLAGCCHPEFNRGSVPFQITSGLLAGSGSLWLLD